MKTHAILSSVLTGLMVIGFSLPLSAQAYYPHHYHHHNNEASAAAIGFLIGAATVGSFNQSQNYQRCYYQCVRVDYYGQCIESRRYCSYHNYYPYRQCDRWGCW